MLKTTKYSSLGCGPWRTGKVMARWRHLGWFLPWVASLVRSRGTASCSVYSSIIFLHKMSHLAVRGKAGGRLAPKKQWVGTRKYLQTKRQWSRWGQPVEVPCWVTDGKRASGRTQNMGQGSETVLANKVTAYRHPHTVSESLWFNLQMGTSAWC